MDLLQHKAVHKYQVPRDNKGSFVDVEIHVSRLRTDNLDLATWGASYVLANQLHRIEVDTSAFGNDEITVLEIGAGTGLVGLSAAAIWKTPVILTDLDAILPGIAKNIEANQQTLAVNGSSAVCGSLDWNNPDKLTVYSQYADGRAKTYASDTDKATVIFAADTIYSEEHPLVLSTTILAWLKPGKLSRAIIAYPLRVAYLDAIRELWHRLEEGGLYSIDEGKAETGDEWDDERSHEWSVWAWKEEKR